MDSGRFLLAVVLMIAVMVVTNLLLPPEPPPVDPMAPDTTAVGPATVPAGEPPGAVLDTMAAGDAGQAAPAPAVPVDTGATPGLTTPAATAGVSADTIVARTALYDYRVSTAGAGIVGAELHQHIVLDPARHGQPVELSWDTVPGLFSYRLRVGTREIPLDDLNFLPSASGVVDVAGGQPGTLELRHEGEDLGIVVAYAFDPDRYVITGRMVVTGLGGQAPTLLINLPRRLAMNEANPQEDERMLEYVVNADRDGVSKVRLNSVRAQRVENGPLHWAAVKNKYFVAAAVTHPESPTAFGGLVANPVSEPNAADMYVTLQPDPDGTFGFRFYIGPQEPRRLAEVGQKFSDVNPFGWRAFRIFLQPLGHGITAALYWMHDNLGIGYGWVLVLFGVLIRIALWPLNAKAMRSQMKNMEIQPRMKEIQAKYKNEPEKLQKELLRLYKEEGFNPMGGCLPMLIPLPILITLFFVLQSTIAFRGVPFLWLPDLSRADPFYILPVLLGVSMFLMQWLSMRSMTDQNPQMKFMMYAMPPVMTIIFLNFASGLNLYYAAMNFASIPQQLQISRERKRFQQARQGAPKAEA
ncbi:MAG TPA: membrane protein insertase YidC [Longimicrobiales bacterium]|nr:membrane protein insertase YidC [Longimicrobiales bacterium]